MTIQLSVLLWTVINFCLLMLILQRLLFAPLLSFMDQRNEKIARAAEKKAAREKVLSEQAAALARRKEEAERQAAADAVTAIDEAHKTAAAKVAAVQKTHESTIAAYRVALGEEDKKMKAGLDAGKDELAAAFISGVLS